MHKKRNFIDKNYLKSIILDQLEEKKIILQDTVDRTITGKIKPLLDTKLIKVISGIRRCGKSVLEHQILTGKDYSFINFDDERLTNLKTEELNLILEIFLELNPKIKYILFDEIQNVPNWELFVNRLHRTGYNIVLTGSNSKLLSRELATSLTGRHLSFELYPFSFKKFLDYQHFNSLRPVTTGNPPAKKQPDGVSKNVARVIDLTTFKKLSRLNRDLSDAGSFVQRALSLTCLLWASCPKVLLVITQNAAVATYKLFLRITAYLP